MGGIPIVVITVLEAHVAREKWDILKKLFEEGMKSLPSQMVQAFLVQSEEDPTLWQGISVWRSREALEEYRRSVLTPAGILMFRAAGAEPTLALFDVAAHGTVASASA